MTGAPIQDLVAWIEAYAVARSTGNQLVQTLVAGAMNQYLGTITVTQNLPDQEPVPEEGLGPDEFPKPVAEEEALQEAFEPQAEPEPAMDAKEPIRPEE